MENLDLRVKEIALAPREQRDEPARKLWNELQTHGVYPASIVNVYRALASGQITLTAPAMNVRGLTYEIARCVWRTALRLNASPVVFEIAPSEMVAGDQTADEYTAMVFAAAVREGYRGPIFIQGDHFHVESLNDLDQLKQLCRDAIASGWYQIDIDGSHIVDAQATNTIEVQRPNAQATAEVVRFVRANQPAGVHITMGGEVGEIGGRNTKIEDVDAFMSELKNNLPANVPGIDKFSAQTGTIHGGLLKPDGTLGKMPLDVELARTLASDARRKHALTGLVQHGASTLGFDDLARLPQAGVIEVHLATGIQNVVFDHPAFPRDLLATMRATLAPGNVGAEGDVHQSNEAMSDAARFYQARWKAWGDFKRELWNMPESNWTAITPALEDWFTQLFRALQIVDQRPAVERLYREAHR